MSYQTNSVILLGSPQRTEALKRLENAPDGIEVVFREPVKKRSKEANSYAWAGVIADYVTYGWVQGKQFPAAAWHAYLKEKFLPDQPEEGYTLAGYVKWVELPSGELKCVGSTTMLTVKGFARYIEECIAYGASELGIRFSVKS